MLRVVQVCDGLRRRGTGTGHCRQCSARDSAVRPDRGTTKAITLRDRSGHLQDVLTLGPVQGPRSFCWAALPFIAGVGGADLPSPYHPSGRRANSRSISYIRVASHGRPRPVALWPHATTPPKTPPEHARPATAQLTDIDSKAASSPTSARCSAHTNERRTPAQPQTAYTHQTATQDQRPCTD
jgi:hypothetical protein